MPNDTDKLPIGNTARVETIAATSTDFGAVIREQRKRLGLRQVDLAGLGGTGNRLIVDLENGKPTVQLQKALDMLALLGLEVVLRPRTTEMP
ncbi:MAG: helix-turn-helix transcriptional regulator [Janthinobacterium lividum]